MKLFLTIIFSISLVTGAKASSFIDKIKIGSNAKTSELEIRYNCNKNKVQTANVVITDAAGDDVSSFTCEIKKGSNAVCMHNALQLPEGIYTVKMMVKKKVFTSKIVLFN